MTTVIDSVRRLTEPVGALGGMWMLDREVLNPCREVGYPNGYAYYVTGRGGVLGDVDADVVSAAFGFFHPSLVRKMWETGVVVEGARAAAARYGAACAQFGRTRAAGFAHTARLAHLAGRVADGIDATGLSLFAGWRAEPRPPDADGAAMFLLHVLRELRGSVHLLAVVASSLAPLDAVLVAGGAAQAELFGWPSPYPAVAADAKKPAEDLTDTLVAGLYSTVLTEQEAAELASLAAALHRHVGGGH